MKITPQPEHKNTTSLIIHKHKQINKQTVSWVVTWLGQGGAERVHRLGTGQPAVPRPAVLAFHRFTHSYRWKRIIFWGQNKNHIPHKIYKSIIIELHYHFQMYLYIFLLSHVILRICSYYLRQSLKLGNESHGLWNDILNWDLLTRNDGTIKCWFEFENVYEHVYVYISNV